MTSFLRILIVLSIAWFAMGSACAHGHLYVSAQSANAHAQMQRDGASQTPYAASSMRPRCVEPAGQTASCCHEHCPCCVMACGANAGALIAMLHLFEPHAPGAASLEPQPESPHEGVSRAPPVRPPIV
jgi:hypothetical protein